MREARIVTSSRRGGRFPSHTAASRLAYLLLFGACLCLPSKVHASPPAPETVPKVDLQRYAGTWYEIARIDHFFQKGCTGGTATYTLIGKSEFGVLNRCRNEADGKMREANGRAWSVDPKGNARLKISFFWPVRSDYWILEVGKEYEYAVVGAPDREYLWVLARRKTLDEGIYQGIVSRAAAQGFPVEKLVRK